MNRRGVAAQQYYDRHAGSYDRQMEVAERRLFGAQREWATSRAVGSVLELAVGTGLNLTLYPEHVRHVLGIDASSAMLEHARRRRDQLPRRDRVELRQGDAQLLDLADDSMDTVLATYALCTLGDPHAALLEARRVLRPDGRLLLVEHGPGRPRWVRMVQRALNPLTVRWQADDLLRDPRRSAVGAGFEIVEADQVGMSGLVHRVHARLPASGSPIS